MSGKQDAIDACACPRSPGENLAAPLCSVELDTGVKDGVLFVSMPPQLECPMARRFSYGEFCVDQHRVRVYRHYGV